jgi:ADP-L-glycero-D-manno-heptose 6-epimerase
MYIVTGGAGLIGSSVVWGLNQRGITDILIVDHLGTSDKWKNLRGLKYSDYIERDDLFEFFENEEFLDSVECIIHMGACSATTERDATYLIHNNFEYSKELALFSVENNIRFVYASSAATYGDGALGYSDDESALDNLRPMNMYGYSKHMFDLWAKKTGLLEQIIGLKFTNVYGSNELHKAGMRSMVCRAYEQIVETGKVSLFKSYKPEYKDGEQKRDFIYVKDVVDMLLFLVFNEDVKGGIYNIGSGKAETWIELVEAVFAAMQRPVNIKFIDMPEHLRDRYQYYTKADMSKFYALGYDKEITSLKDAIHDYVVNYISQEKFLGDE